MIFGFTILIWLAVRTYTDAPPIPEKVVGPGGEILFTGEDIQAGQQVFLKYGLMENGSIWGHGAYLGPDFSAKYLHALATDASDMLAKQRYQRTLAELSASQRSVIHAEIQASLKQNRYDPATRALVFTEPEAASYRTQIQKWSSYFSAPTASYGLPGDYIKDSRELRHLTAFFAWTAWASVANRPGKAYSYTNNFPYDPMVGNTATSDAVLWSGLSLIALLVGTALVLLAFGRFDFLGWKGQTGHAHPQMIPGAATPSQKATIKYFGLVALLFLAQAMVGGATAHYRADPGSFYGLDLSQFFSSNILRTWHLQLAIFGLRLPTLAADCSWPLS
jgi:nitric oxide reductase subunit B